MPQGSKAKYTSKQKRQAKHIEDSELEQGRPTKKAKQIAWATVNKRTGGAGRSASKKSHSSSAHSH